MLSIVLLKILNRVVVARLAEGLALVAEAELPFLLVGNIRDALIDADVIAIKSDYRFGDHNPVLHGGLLKILLYFLSEH